MAVFVIFGSHGFPGMKPPAVETVRLKESGGGGADMKKVRASLCILGVTAAAVTVMMALPAISRGALRTENAARVLACIGARPVGLDQLSSQTGLAAGALLGALTCLELGGYIAAQPGRQYVLK